MENEHYFALCRSSVFCTHCLSLSNPCPSLCLIPHHLQWEDSERLCIALDAKETPHTYPIHLKNLLIHRPSSSRPSHAGFRARGGPSPSLTDSGTNTHFVYFILLIDRKMPLYSIHLALGTHINNCSNGNIGKAKLLLL